MWLLFAATYVALLPFERLWDNLLGTSTIFKPYRLVGMALLVLLVLRNLATRTAFILDRYDQAIIGVFLWGAAMAGFWHLVNGVSLEPTANEGTLIAFALLTCLALKNTLNQRNHLAIILDVYVLAFVAAMVASVVLVADPFADRFRGLYKNPNQAGFVAALAVLVLVARFYFEAGVGGIRRISYAALAIGFAAVLALSGSRGSLIGVAAGLVSFVLTARYASTVAITRAQRLAIVGLGVVALAVVGPRAWTAMQQETAAFDRYSPEAVSNFSGRLDIWRAALAVAVDHYLVGAGIGQYRNYHQEYVRRLPNIYAPRMVEFRLNTHSDLVGLLTNFGLPGLLLYAWVVLRLLRASWRSVRLGAHEHYIYPALFAIELLTLVSEVFRDSFISPEFFFVQALVMIAARRGALGSLGRRPAATPLPAIDARSAA
ncbi:MAG: O-antigen ligase family protein [Proteobacteria bacterium]|nr:O-antigen ligase family protein [Pseudomonadota bacterium]